MKEINGSVTVGDDVKSRGPPSKKKQKEKLNYFTVNTFILNSREAAVSLEWSDVKKETVNAPF